ncbi:MAG: hypothetical protein K2P94_12925 [Rhodospirillaceae bacterium]|nr:hypothetical protein [Rhodospirillaceae bacterium]
MAHPAIADLTLHDLTLEERAILERAVDGPITPVMIADALRARPAAPRPDTPAALRRLLAWASSDLAFYRGQITALETEIATVMADGGEYYGDTEKARKTRHVAALHRQRDGLAAHCGPYEAMIAYARNTLAAASPESAHRATCRPSAFQDGLSED